MTNTQNFLYFTAEKSLTKISRCQKYAINGQQMEQLESPFGSIFLSFLMKVGGCQAYSSCWNFNKFCDTAALYFNHPNSFWPKLEFHYPGYQRFFLCVAGIFVVGQKPTHLRPPKPRQANLREKTGHYKDLTETRNHARKVSGTQGGVSCVRRSQWPWQPQGRLLFITNGSYRYITATADLTKTHVHTEINSIPSTHFSSRSVLCFILRCCCCKSS